MRYSPNAPILDSVTTTTDERVIMTTIDTTTTWTKAEAKAADAELSRLVDLSYEAVEACERAEKRAVRTAPVTWHSMRNSRGQRTGQSYPSLDGGETYADIYDVLKIEDPSDELVEAIEAYHAAKSASLAAGAAVSAHDREHYKGWQRFFLVQDGHIHASTGCHSLRPTTRIGWLPKLSGETEAEAVAEHGAMLCTFCFPTAPVEWTDGRKADDHLYCAGGGTWDYPRETARLGYYTGNYGVCTHCGEKITVTSTGKMRKHKKPA